MAKYLFYHARHLLQFLYSEAAEEITVSNVERYVRHHAMWTGGAKVVLVFV